MSQHPADRLIRDLLATRRAATGEEVAAIKARMASAPFNERVVRVPPEYRGLSYQGHTLGSRERSLRLHLVQRVVEDEQWAEGTTEASYRADLHDAIRHPSARLLIYARRGGLIAAALATTMLPPEHLGATPLPLLYVVYSVDHSTILSG